MSSSKSGVNEGKSAFRSVQSHSDVCGNCFRRTHNTVERNYAVDTFKVDDFEWGLWLRKVDLPDRSYPVRENRIKVPARRITAGLHGRCRCGYPPGEQHRPLRKTLFFEYANNLYDRYTEFGVIIDEDEFKDELKALKTDPSEQFADDRLYEKATNKALKP